MRVIIFFVVVCLVSCGKGQVKETVIITPADRSKLYLQFPEAQEIQFFGKVPVDTEIGQSGGMAYPGYGLAGFVAAVATHAVIQSGVSSAAEKRKIEEANLVLEKYQPFLEKVDAKSVLGAGFSVYSKQQNIEVNNLGGGSSEENLFFASVKPVFYLTQDEKTLILVNEMNFGETLVPENGVDSVVVYYVSSPAPEEAEKYWAFDDFYNLDERIRKLFIASVEVGLKEYVGDYRVDGQKQQTIRYVESGKKKVERGGVITSTCDRIVFQTLRGAIKSVPVSPLEGACEGA